MSCHQPATVTPRSAPSPLVYLHGLFNIQQTRSTCRVFLLFQSSHRMFSKLKKELMIAYYRPTQSTLSAW